MALSCQRGRTKKEREPRERERPATFLSLCPSIWSSPVPFPPRPRRGSPPSRPSSEAVWCGRLLESKGKRGGCSPLPPPLLCWRMLLGGGLACFRACQRPSPLAGGGGGGVRPIEAPSRRSYSNGVLGGAGIGFDSEHLICASDICEWSSTMKRASRHS